MAFGNMNRYCLSFGLAILGGTIAMWGILDMLAKDEEMLEYEKAMYEEDKDEKDDTDYSVIEDEVRRIKKAKTRKALFYGICGLIIIIMAFTVV